MGPFWNTTAHEYSKAIVVRGAILCLDSLRLQIQTTLPVESPKIVGRLCQTPIRRFTETPYKSFAYPACGRNSSRTILPFFTV